MITNGRFRWKTTIAAPAAAVIATVLVICCLCRTEGPREIETAATVETVARQAKEIGTEGVSSADVEESAVSEKGIGKAADDSALAQSSESGPGAADATIGGALALPRFGRNYAPYRDAETLEERETALDGESVRRVRIVRTDMKYPLVRVEEKVTRDGATGKETATIVSEMVADHVLVRLRPGVTEDDLLALNARHGTTIRKKMYAEGHYLVQAQGCDVDTVRKLVETYRAETASVAYAEPDHIVHALGNVPDDPHFDKLWGMHNSGQYSGMGTGHVRAPELSNEYFGHGLEYAGGTGPTGITGKAIYCGYGLPDEIPAEVSGNIALIERGGTNDDGEALTFAEKLTNATAAGAKAAIFYQMMGYEMLFYYSLGHEADWIPAISIQGGRVAEMRAYGTPTITLYNRSKADADIDAPEAWTAATGSRDVLVGVIDTGIDYTHPDLAANMWHNPGETGTDGSGRDKRTNGVDDDGNGFVDDWNGWDFCNDDNDPFDDHFHGTHCAGTIGGVGNNAEGVAGVSWNVSLVGLKFLSAGGSGTFADSVDAVYYGTKIGCDLTSNSWGAAPGQGGYFQALADAIADADSKGVLFVAAAGNSDNDNDAMPTYPGSYTNPNVIAVAATDPTDGRAWFSSYGETSVDIGAPGVAVYSCIPTWYMDEPGVEAIYWPLNGTSMATPHVAGACALLKSVDPDLTHMQIKNRLLGSVDPIESMTGKVLSNGRMNICRALEGMIPGPFVARGDSAVDDASGGTSGNGDGIANPGETVRLRVTLRNIGKEIASGVSAELSLAEADQYISILDGSAGYGDITSGGEAAGDGFLLQIAAGAPTPHLVTFDLTMTDGAGNGWQDGVELVVCETALVSGTVRLDGAALAGATVVIDGASRATVTTGSDGKYSAAVGSGTYGVGAEYGGALATHPVEVTVPPDRTGVDFDFTTATVSGTVVDGGSGQPIEGATVRYLGVVSGSVVTDSNGVFTIEGVYGRGVTLSLSASKQPDYQDSGETTVVVPPDVSGVTLELTRPDIDVNPTAFDIEAEFGQLVKRTLTVANTGTRGLEWAVDVGDAMGGIRTKHVYGTTSGNSPSWHGLEFDGTNLLAVDYTTLRRINPATGGTVGTLALGVRALDIALDGNTLWVTDPDNRKIHQLSLADGSKLKTFDPPYQTVPSAIAVGGGYVWTYDISWGMIYKQDPETGELVGDGLYCPVYVGFSWGIAYRDGAIWMAEADSWDTSSATLEVFKLDPEDGSIIRQYQDPAYFRYSISYAFGVCRAGDSFWVLGISAEPGDGGQPGETTLCELAAGACEWVTAVPEQGQIWGQDDQGVALEFDSVKAGVGMNTTTIKVSSNDPDEPVVEVPVTFTVTPTQAKIALTADNVAPSVGGTFTVAVNLQTAPPFANWGEFLGFDGSMVELVSQATGAFETFIPDSRSLSDINATGQVRAGGYRLNNNMGGNGTLGLFTFRAKAEGTTQIATGPKSGTNPFGNVLQPLEGGEVLPSDGGPLTITIGGSAQPTIVLTASNAAPNVGETFTVTVGLQNGPPFASWGQLLKFDGAAVRVDGQAAGTFPTFIPDARSVDEINATGEVHAGGYGMDDNAGGTGSLGVFTFRAAAAGTTQIATEAWSGTSPFGCVLVQAAGSRVVPAIAGALTIEVGGGGGNTPPVAQDVRVTTAEDTAKAITLSATDADGDALTYHIVSGPSHGALSGSGSGVTYTPALNYHGADSFAFKANDGMADSNTATVTITVTPVNDAPMVTASADPTSGEAPLAVQFTAAGSDVDGDALTYSWTFGDGGASGSQNPGHTYAAAGTYTAKVTVSDGNGGTASAQVVITVAEPANTPPVAQNQSVTTTEDTAKGITLVAADADGDALTYSIVSGPTEGTLSGTAPNVTYTPDHNYFGSDSFTFRANDGEDDSNVATVSITVTPVNDAPTVTASADPTSGEAPLSVQFGAVGDDVDGDALTYSWVFGDGGTSSEQNPAHVYEAAGTYTAVVTVSDGDLTASASITITVTETPDTDWVEPFEAYEMESQLHGQGGWKGWDNSSAYGALVSGTQKHAGEKSVAIVGSSDLVHEYAGYTTGTWAYSAWQFVPADFSGAQYFIMLNTYNDGGAKKWCVQVSFSAATGKVHSDHDGAELALVKGRWVKIQLVIDLDADVQKFFYDGQKLYEKSWMNGVDSGGAADIAAVDLFANGASAVYYDDMSLLPYTEEENTPPVAEDQDVTTEEDTPVDITLVATDADGDALTYAIVAGPANGVLSGAVPSVTYTPRHNYDGADSFTFRANDGRADSNVATVSITVLGINDPPAAADDAASTVEDTAVTIDVLANDTDPEGDALSVSAVTQPANGAVANNGTNVTYTPDADWSGQDVFSYTVSDDNGGTDTATVTVTVSSANDAPVAVDDTATTLEDTAVTIDVLANDSDPDGDALSVASVSDPANGTAAVSGNAVLYTPDHNYYGVDSFSYTASDGRGGESTATVTVTVTPVNDAPVAVASANPTSGNAPLTVQFDGSASSDVDGTIVDYEWDLGESSDYGPQVSYTFTTPGTYTVTLYVFDDAGASDSASLTITVTEKVNTAPVAHDQAVVIDEDTTAAITLSATDAEGDALTYAIVDDPGYGMLTGTAPNVTYVPDEDYYGEDSFTFRANDGQADSNTATVSITVNPVNDAPVARDGNVLTSADSPVDITLRAYDVDGDALTYAIAEAPANGVVSGDDGDGTVTYTPNDGFAGDDTFTFVANDGDLDSNVATITVAVQGELVTIVSVSTGRPYSLATAEAGALYYIDRKYTILSLASEFSGGVLVRTANNDKYVTEPNHLTLRIGREAIVSVCYDKRWAVLPNWLDDGTWTYAGADIVVTDKGASPMDVFEKTVPAGEITLGGNRAGGASGARSMYTVVVRPTAATIAKLAKMGTEFNSVPIFLEGPLAATEWLNEGDADGDGLTDVFEQTVGLDPRDVDTNANGVYDEYEAGPDGRDWFDLQLDGSTPGDPDDGTPGGGGGSGGGCFVKTAGMK